MLVQCWPTICDAGPASNQHWFNASCLLGCFQPSKHKIFVQCWANVGSVVPTLYKCYTNVLCLLGIAAGLVLLADYKPKPTQCLLNVGPVSPVLASIHSVLISTSFCHTCIIDGIVRARCFEPKLG